MDPKKTVAALLTAVTLTAAAPPPPARAVSLAWLWPQRPSVFSGPAVVSGPAFEDTRGRSSQDVFTLLGALGIFRGQQAPVRYADPDKKVNRAELATLVVRMLKHEDLAGALADFEPQYQDSKEIPEWARGYVNAVTSLGIMAGDEAGRFNWNEPVTVAQALAVLTRALGNEPAVGKGSYPDRYMAFAREYRLLPWGVEDDPYHEINREELARLVHSALNAGRWSPKEKRVRPEDTLLKGYYGVAEGVVDEADPARGTLYLSDGEGNGSPGRTLGSQVFLVKAKELRDLQGKRVRAVARDGVIVYVEVLR